MDSPRSNYTYIERKIIIGLVVSTKYFKRISDIFELNFIKSVEAKKIALWCIEYFEKYGKAPKKEIENIYMAKLPGLLKEQADIIETILEGLSDEYDRKKFNVDYLVDETEKYFKKQQLTLHYEAIQTAVENDELLEAENEASNFNIVEQIKSSAVTPLGSMEQCKQAHESILNPLISFGDTPLGYIMNEALVREGFVAIMGQNKGGKTFNMMNLAIKGAEQGNNVTFFSVGDMTQPQMERRMAIYYLMRSDLPKYCSQLFIPIIDCVYNQSGECNKAIREGGIDSEHPFPGRLDKDIRCEPNSKNPVLQNELIKSFYKFPEHKPCYNCFRSGNTWDFKGTIWYKERKKVKPATWKDTYKVSQKYNNTLKRIKLITYPNEALTMRKVNVELDILEKQGFITDVGLIDYIDNMESDEDTLKYQMRDQINKKWQRGRRISQERKILLIGATQSDALGFDAALLGRKNFNNDRRILDHITALYGLNMSDREKKRGTMRINNILEREGEGSQVIQVYHRLQIGRPILGSFF